MNPDTWIKWCYSTREDLGAPARKIVQATGLVYSEKFAHSHPDTNKRCHSTKRNPTSAGHDVCAVCGAVWPWQIRYLLKGAIQSSLDAGRFENQISRYVDISAELGRMLDSRRWKWPTRLYIANVLGWSQLEILNQGPKIWPRSPVDWTVWGVRSAVKEARSEWTERLTRIQDSW